MGIRLGWQERASHDQLAVKVMSNACGIETKLVLSDRCVAARIAAIEADLARIASELDTLVQIEKARPADLVGAVDKLNRLRLETAQLPARAAAMEPFAMTPLTLLCLDSEQLTLVQGIDAAAAQLLNEAGIHRFADVAALTPEDVSELGQMLSDTRRISTQCWIEQAALLAAGIETQYAARIRAGHFAGLADMSERDQVGVGSMAPTTAIARAAAMEPFAMTPLTLLCLDSEQLTLVQGIDAAAAQLLNEAGIHRFADVAALTPEDVAELGQMLSDTRRISTQCWIEQAALLAAGIETQYAARIRAGHFAGLADMSERDQVGVGSMAPTTASAQIIDLAARRTKSGGADFLRCGGRAGCWIGSVGRRADCHDNKWHRPRAKDRPQLHELVRVYNVTASVELRADAPASIVLRPSLSGFGREIIGAAEPCAGFGRSGSIMPSANFVLVLIAVAPIAKVKCFKTLTF